MANGEDVTPTTFSCLLKQKTVGKDGFIDWAVDFMYNRHLKPLTIKAHLHTFDALRQFGKIKYFDDLTPVNMKAFDSWLRLHNPDMQQTTIYGYHKRLKPYINEAVERGIIAVSPYDKFKVSQGKYKPKEALDEQELYDLRHLMLTDESLIRARDLFVFCTYTGLAHVDMSCFKFDRDTQCVNGTYYIDGKRVKTGTKYYTPILPPAMEVLEKYNYRLPRMSQQCYNRLLKCLGSMIGTRKNMSSHIARYTFATTVLLAHEVPIESVSKMLGHTRIQITQLYAKILNTSIEKQAERLAGIL